MQGDVTVRCVIDDDKDHKEHFSLGMEETLAELRKNLLDRLGLEETTLVTFSVAGVPLLDQNLTLKNVFAARSIAQELRAEISKETPPALQVPSKLTPAKLNLLSVDPTYILLKEKDIDEELQCKICFGVCLDPVVLGCCQNMICSKCMVGAGAICPFDRNALNEALLLPPQKIYRVQNRP